ncbi:MAG: hypothetical protein U0Z75_09090 [Deinococcaceae bacterium]
MKYVKTIGIQRREAKRLLRSSDRYKSEDILYGISKILGNKKWKQDIYSLYAKSDKPISLRRVAVINLGNMARIEGLKNPKMVIRLLLNLKDKESMDGAVENAIDDILIFCKLKR